jgi:hypothetical protein
MDKTELTKKMLEWEEKKKELNILEKEIQEEVFLMRETFRAGNIIAKFSKGKKTYDYEAVGQDAPEKLIEENTEVVEKINWKAICDAMGINKKIIPFKDGTSSVKLSIEGNEEFSDEDYVKDSEDLPF